MSSGKDHEGIKIRDLSPDDRPREKLLQQGPKSLSNAELLALLLNSGTRNESVIQVAQRLLASVGHDLDELAKKTVAELKEIQGIGPAKAVVIKAALELSVRMSSAKKDHGLQIKTSQDAFHILREKFYGLEHEEFHVLLLNRANKVLNTFCHTRGGYHGTVVDVKKLAREVILHKASGVILAHNHPGENLTPSEEDKACTRKVKEAMKLVDCSLLDHLIICNNRYLSFADEGWL